MRLKVQIVKNAEDYYKEMEMYLNDSLLYPKPDVELDEADYNIADDLIDGYRIVNPEQSESGNKEILVFTILGEYIVKYNDLVLEELNEVMSIRKSLFRKGLLK